MQRNPIGRLWGGDLWWAGHSMGHGASRCAILACPLQGAAAVEPLAHADSSCVISSDLTIWRGTVSRGNSPCDASTTKLKRVPSRTYATSSWKSVELRILPACSASRLLRSTSSALLCARASLSASSIAASSAYSSSASEAIPPPPVVAPTAPVAPAATAPTSKAMALDEGSPPCGAKCDGGGAPPIAGAPPIGICMPIGAGGIPAAVSSE
mmetsp:Transcript_64615/g.127681  ORF Transcript_64615/g.127681 Transcript_64615/m.127681 type:complete len:211 (-) Transcript_64615:2207-2839(-)